MALNEKNKSKTKIEAHKDICTAKECQDLVANACTKML